MATDANDFVDLRVLGERIAHQQEDLAEVKGGMKQVLALVATLASRDEVKALRDEITTLRAEATELRASIRAWETRLRVVEDDRTAARAVLGVAGIGGLGLLGALLKWLISAP